MLKRGKDNGTQPNKKLSGKKQAHTREKKVSRKTAADNSAKASDADSIKPPDRLGKYRLAYTLPTDTTPKIIIEGVMSMGMPPLILNKAAFRYRDLSYLDSFVKQTGLDDVPKDYVETSVKPVSSSDPDDVEVDIL